MFGIIGEKNNLSTKIKVEINKAWSNSGRLKGASVGTSSKGQTFFQKVELSLFSVENIDKISKILSSNICKHYFYMLVKHAGGKRTKMSAMDN